MKKQTNEKLSFIRNNTIYETVYDPENESTRYVHLENGVSVYTDEYHHTDAVFKPLSSHSTYITQQMVCLPSECPARPGRPELIDNIRNFIHAYVDVPKEFETVATYYVLMTWVYERFDNVPYIRARGNPGHGKSRFLDVMSALCYRTISFKADPSDSVLFRAMDKIRGTVAIDEFDRHYSSNTDGITQMLNNGFAKNGNVARSKATKDGGFEPEFFKVFGPKIIGNRQLFKDDALESRCISQYMGNKKPRDEVLVNLGDEFEQKALELRNQLLSFRLHDYFDIDPVQMKDIDLPISARSKQIAVPLVTLMSENDKEDLMKILQQAEQKLSDGRDDSHEVDVLKALVTLVNKQVALASVGDITNIVNIGKDQWESLKSRRVGNILSGLNISRAKGGPNGNRMVSIAGNQKQILAQAEHYDVPVDTVITEESFFDVMSENTGLPGHAGHADEYIAKEDNPFENDRLIEKW